MDAKTSSYPLTAMIRSPRGRAVGEFLEWLETQNLHLARSVGESYQPLPSNPSHLIARFLGIDPQDLAAEKEIMARDSARF